MDNSFAKIHPELITEWSDKNDITPDMISFGSNKLFWWQGKCGHEWQASPKSRSSGENCPICAGKKVVQGINDLETLKPELAKEWSPKNTLKPNEVTKGSNKKVLWIDSLGHEWKATVKNRVQGSGCPYCSHRAVLSGFNDLASLLPEIAGEWSDRNLPLTPDKVSVFANRKVWWKCKNGHEWNTLISSRSAGSKCPYCSGITLLRGFNDLATRYPQLAAEWSENNNFSPDTVNEKSRKNVWWHCRKCGNEYRAVIHSRVNGLTCPVCADRAVLRGFNDIGTTDPHLIKEWDYGLNDKHTPYMFSRSSRQSVWWRCSFGHTYKARIAEKTIDGCGCKVCESDYQRIFPKLALLYYIKREGLSVQLSTDKIIGIPLEAYIPDEKIAVETEVTSDMIESLKQYLCAKRGIKLLKVLRQAKESESEYAFKVKKSLMGVHIFICSDEDKDIQIIRKQFNEWRKLQYEKQKISLISDE